MTTPFLVLYFSLLFMVVPSVGSAGPEEQGIECPPGTGQVVDSGICSDAGQTIIPFTQPGSGVLQPLPGLQRSVATHTAGKKPGRPPLKNPEKGAVIVYFFW